MEKVSMPIYIPNWSSYQFTVIGLVEDTIWSLRPSFDGNGNGWIEIKRVPRHGKVEIDVDVQLNFGPLVSRYRDRLSDGQRSIRFDCSIQGRNRNGTMGGYLTVHYNSATRTREVDTQTENNITMIELPANGSLINKKEAVTQTENYTSTMAEKTTPSSLLVSDFLHLLNNPDCFSDATLVCGYNKLQVHRNILSARSPVFAAMFKTQMQEGREGVVDIVDMEPDVLQAMLRYVYTGTTDHLTPSLAGDLLFGVDKYQLEELKLICVEELKTSMAANNVLRSVVLGDLHDKSLKAHAVEFICQYKKFSDFEETEEWQFLLKERPSLAVEVATTVVKYLQNK